MEIMFRGKDVESGKWLYGWVFGEKAKSIIELDTKYASKEGVEAYCTSVVIPETVGRYTGRKDRNGVDIYEGDIANHKDYECFGKVVFSDGELAFAFLVVTGSNNKGPTTEFEWLYEYADGLEVIGNITDNPELMEVRD